MGPLQIPLTPRGWDAPHGGFHGSPQAFQYFQFERVTFGLFSERNLIGFKLYPIFKLFKLAKSRIMFTLNPDITLIRQSDFEIIKYFKERRQPPSAPRNMQIH